MVKEGLRLGERRVILVLAGTHDARDLVLALQTHGIPVLVSTVTEHAAQAYRGAGIGVRTGRLDADGLTHLLRGQRIQCLVDATHPFAAEAHRNGHDAASAMGIPYIRYERRSEQTLLSLLLPSPLLHFVNDDREAAELVASLGETVFLATGSKALPVYARRLLPHIRLVVRLLPTSENLERCEELGIDQANIVGLQGPFDTALNRALYDHFSIDVLITKESGAEGKVREKVLPALERGSHVIIIRRPPSVEGHPEGTRCFTDREELVSYLLSMLRQPPQR
jgi:precorrin-6A/cobalt-precorrin-6A reductase